jgi:NAD(P)-dependent dehydrogenase (short-subunit alcohol dehydrogenase family)
MAAGDWTIAGKIVLVTGATGGIGLETAAALAAMGARPILVGRDAGRLARAADTVRWRGGAAAGAYLCDLASLAAVRRLVDDVRRAHRRIDVLINNAGGVHRRRALTADGLEATFAINHLSHFALTTGLLDLMTSGGPARVITVASAGHRRGAIDFADLQLRRGYGVLRAYYQSKLANVLFANELARRLAGTGVTSNSVHPGTVATNIWSGAPIWAQPYIRLWLSRSFTPVAAGAAPVVRLAARADLTGVTGRYFEGQSDVAPAPPAMDEALAARLWSASERLVGPFFT